MPVVYQNRLRMHQGVSCHNLEEVIVKSPEDIIEIMRKAMAKRQVAATKLNKTSSRSHCIFTLTVHIKETTPEGEDLLKVGKLNLVDLAGSESIGRSGAKDKRAREAGNINRSLLTLGRVISALVERTPHIPYRDSKLTRLLQESLGGRAKTCIIATVAPSVQCLDETLSTLDYASRAKSIKNKPEANQKMTKRALIKEYAEDIARLREELAFARSKDGVFLPEEQYNSMISDLDSKKTQLEELESALETRQTELDDLTALFEKTSQTLQITEGELVETKTKLTNTELELGGTKIELLKEKTRVKENRIVINAHKETEAKLQETSKALHQTIEEITKDTDLLHAKIARQHNTEDANFEISHKHFEFASTSLTEIKSKAGAYCSKQDVLLREHMAKAQEHIDSVNAKQTVIHESLSGLILENKKRTEEMICSLKSSIEELKKESICELENGMVASGDRVATALRASNKELVEGIANVLSSHVAETNVAREKWQRSIKGVLTAQRESIESFKSTLQSSLKEMEELMEQQAISYQKELDQGAASLEKFMSDEKEDSASETNLLMDKIKALLLESTSRREQRMSSFLGESVSKHRVLNENVGDNQRRNAQKLTSMRESSQEWTSAAIGALADGEEKQAECATQVCEATKKTATALSQLSQSLNTQMDASLTQIAEQSDSLKSGCSEIRGTIDTITENTTNAANNSHDEAKATIEKALTEVATTKESVAKLQHMSSEDTDNSRSLTQEFKTTLECEADSLNEACRKYVHEELTRDAPTSSTPRKRIYTYPKEIACTSPEHAILGRLREKNPAELDESPVRESKLKPRSNSIDSPWTGNGLDQENDSRACNRERTGEKAGLKRENSVPPPNRSIVFDSGKFESRVGFRLCNNSFE